MEGVEREFANKLSKTPILLVLTIRLGTTSCLAPSKLNCALFFCNCLNSMLKHSYVQAIASALAYLSTKVSAGCHAGVARCSQAGTQNWTFATLTYHTEQEHRERTHSGFLV